MRLNTPEIEASALPVEVLGERQAVLHMLVWSVTELLIVPVDDFQLSLRLLPSELRSVTGQRRTNST